MGVIKGPNVPLTASPFSMTDVEDAAKRVLLRARQQADQLLAAAQAEGESMKAAAKVEGMVLGVKEGTARGLDEGKKSGEAAALNENKAQLLAAITALNDAATKLNATRADLHSMALQEVVKLAIAIARRVTKRQGILDPDILTSNLEEAMKLVVANTDIRIEINPNQRQVLDIALPKLAMKWPSLKHVEVVEDAAIAPGGSRISTCQGQINAELEVQLDRVVADLLPSSQEMTQ